MVQAYSFTFRTGESRRRQPARYRRVALYGPTRGRKTILVEIERSTCRKVAQPSRNTSAKLTNGAEHAGARRTFDPCNVCHDTRSWTTQNRIGFRARHVVHQHAAFDLIVVIIFSLIGLLMTIALTWLLPFSYEIGAALTQL